MKAYMKKLQAWWTSRASYQCIVKSNVQENFHIQAIPYNQGQVRRCAIELKYGVCLVSVARQNVQNDLVYHWYINFFSEEYKNYNFVDHVPTLNIRLNSSKFRSFSITSWGLCVSYFSLCLLILSVTWKVVSLLQFQSSYAL